MQRRRALVPVLMALLVLILSGRGLHAATEVKLDKDFLAGIVEKLPPSPFEKKGQYQGTVHSIRLLAIDPKRRRFLASCQVEGAFRPPASGPISEHVSRIDDHAPGVRKFRFEVTTGVNVEAAADGTPRFRVEIEEIKKAELEGIAGLLAKLMGHFFNDMVTQIADCRASSLNQKLNAEIVKRAATIKEYGILCGIDYTPEQVVLRFDLTRFKKDGIAGYVFAGPRPGTVPLHRWFNRRTGAHEYTLSPGGPGGPAWMEEGIACHVPADAAAGTVAFYGWEGRKDRLYTTAEAGEGVRRLGYRPMGAAFRVHAEPVPDAVPFYQFFDPGHGLHFYTTHPHAEFAK